MQYEKAYSFLIANMENEFSAHLTYHNVQHTKDVIAASIHLAATENVSGEGLILLKTAALFHDAGFLEHHENHEAISCDYAKKYLPQFEYNTAQIEKICSMIMATKLPQTPADHLEQILCDADLYYLGTERYETTAEKLFEEFKENGLIKTLHEWKLKQIEFLSSHRYFTKSASAEREACKQKNLAALKSELNQL